MSLIPMKEGDVYSQQRIRKALDKAREVYGSGGYFEFTAYPDLKPRDSTGIVDVTIQVSEGKQYFINRITLTGNTHTRDDVIRRELMLLEEGVFNTEALKNSIRRLNQLGYFKPIESEGVDVQKSPDKDDRVDVAFKVEEQNRNQISFGAGVSQYDGFFGNASFTTANFMGRGETLTVSLQKGTRSNNYSLGFTEPYIFGRAMTAGATVYSRKTDYQMYSESVDYSEVRTGLNVVFGVPVRRFSRFTIGYGYEVADTASSAAFREAYQGTASGGVAGLSLTQGRQTQSAVTPSLIYNTVDQPQAPRRGMRLSGSYEYAGGILGGTTNFVRPEAEAILYVPVSRRTALRLPRQCRRHPELQQHRAAVLPPLLHGRGIPDSRLRHPHGRPAQRQQCRARRHQVRALQRRVLLRHPADGPRAAVPRRRPGLRREARRSICASSARRPARSCGSRSR